MSSDLAKAIHASNSQPVQRAALRELLVGNTLYLHEGAVSFYASPSIRLTLFEGKKYCTEWFMTSSGDLRVQSLRTYRRETYRVMRCAGPDDGFTTADDPVSLFREDDSYFGTLMRGEGNKFGLTIDDATFVTI